MTTTDDDLLRVLEAVERSLPWKHAGYLPLWCWCMGYVGCEEIQGEFRVWLKPAGRAKLSELKGRNNADAE